MLPVMGLILKEGYISDLYSSFSDKSGLTMTVERRLQVSDRIFKESLKDILARGLMRESLATAVEKEELVHGLQTFCH